MKSMQRKFGGLMSKKSADEADVGAILSDYKTADEMLDRLVADLTAFRDGWEKILTMQCNTSGALASLYGPISVPDDAEQRHVPAETPQRYMQKCQDLQTVYSNEQSDLAQEIGMLTQKLVRRAEDAKLHSKPLKKTIKHRENMKLDYERFLSRAESARKKEMRSQKEEMALARHESELAQAKINYQTADEHIKENFPPVTEAIHSLLPYLLTTMIMLQTTLVGQLYTVLDDYTRRQGLPNPAPNDNDIISVWQQEFEGLRNEVETGLQVIVHGKAVHMPLAIPEKSTTVSGLGIRNKVMGRKPPPAPPTAQSRPSMGSRTSSATYSKEDSAPAQPSRPAAPYVNDVSKPHWESQGAGSASSATYEAPPPPYMYETKSTTLTPDWQQRRPSNTYGSHAGTGASPTGSHHAVSPSAVSTKSADYFDPTRSSIASAAAAAVASKKKPPPPIPAKRMPSSTAQFVIALYDFEAQNHGDLAFREGDRIRVVKKTGSNDDWWEGELNGRTGSFPANYVQT